MVATLVSRAIIVVAGMLYPAYSSFKAVRARSHREYTQWMMYWIVFAMFQATEVVTDIFLSWLPFYSEIKIMFVLWLVLPITQGSKQLYRMVIHPFLVRYENQIDETLQNVGSRMRQLLGRATQHGINLAATTVVTSAIRGQAVITETLLQNQQQQQQQGGQGSEQVDGGEAPDPEVVEQRRLRPSSSSSSSNFSEYEMVSAEPEENVQDNPPPATSSSSSPPLTTGGEYPHPDSNGLHHRSS